MHATATIAHPFETLVETVTGSSTGGLDVPRSLTERVETEFVGNLGSVHGVGQILQVSVVVSPGVLERSVEEGRCRREDIGSDVWRALGGRSALLCPAMTPATAGGSKSDRLSGDRMIFLSIADDVAGPSASLDATPPRANTNRNKTHLFVGKDQKQSISKFILAQHSLH